MQREHSVQSVHHQRQRLQQRWDPSTHEAGLFEAARVGDIATLRWLFENGCDVDHQVGKKICRKRAEEFSSYDMRTSLTGQ